MKDNDTWGNTFNIDAPLLPRPTCCWGGITHVAAVLVVLCACQQEASGADLHVPSRTWTWHAVSACSGPPADVSILQLKQPATNILVRPPVKP